MKTDFSFEFKSALFLPLPNEDAETNTQRYGKSLAEWLATRLKNAGNQPLQILPEDWGWLALFTTQAMKVELYCGNTDDLGHEWFIMIKARPTLYERMLQKASVTQKTEKFRQGIAAILNNESGIFELIGR